MLEVSTPDLYSDFITVALPVGGYFFLITATHFSPPVISHLPPSNFFFLSPLHMPHPDQWQSPPCRPQAFRHHHHDGPYFYEDFLVHPSASFILCGKHISPPLITPPPEAMQSAPTGSGVRAPVLHCITPSV